MSGFNLRNPKTGKFARGGKVLTGKKVVSKKAKRKANQAKHRAARAKNRTARKANRNAEAIIAGIATATSVVLAVEGFRSTQFGTQLEKDIRSKATDIQSRYRYRKAGKASGRL